VTKIFENIETWIGLGVAVQKNILWSIFVILFFWLFRKLLFYLINRFKYTLRTSYRLRTFASYFCVALALFFIFKIWFDGFESMATYFGLLSAGIAIALKDPIVDIAGWFFLTFWRPVDVGDRIQIGDIKGDIIHIGFFYFTVNEIGNWVESDQSTGRIIQIPNAKIFTEPQALYSKGFQYIWNEIPVLITFESDWQKTKQILTEIANTYYRDISIEARKKLNQASKNYMIYYKNLTPIVYTDVKDSGVLLTIRYLCDPYQRRGSQQKLWEQILLNFDQHKDIELAYPTLRRV